MYIEVTYHVLHLPAHYHRITWFQITSQSIVQVVENWHLTIHILFIDE